MGKNVLRLENGERGYEYCINYVHEYEASFFNHTRHDKQQQEGMQLRRQQAGGNKGDWGWKGAKKV